jgi:hypothetical protein
MKTRSERDPQQTAQCVCSIPCECGRSYIGETDRHVDFRLLRKSKLAKHAYEGGYMVAWDEARMLEIESNIR